MLENLPDILPLNDATPQTRRDLEKIKQRKNKNSYVFPMMRAYLQQFPKGVLLQVAREISESKQIPPVDRICRRNREALICWFCESAPEVLSKQIPQSSLRPVIAIPELQRPEPQGRILFPSVHELLAQLPDHPFLGDWECTQF
jgi:hypothetical protein